MIEKHFRSEPLRVCLKNIHRAENASFETCLSRLFRAISPIIPRKRALSQDPKSAIFISVNVFQTHSKPGLFRNFYRNRLGVVFRIVVYYVFWCLRFAQAFAHQINRPVAWANLCNFCGRDFDQRFAVGCTDLHGYGEAFGIVLPHKYEGFALAKRCPNPFQIGRFFYRKHRKVEVKRVNRGYI